MFLSTNRLLTFTMQLYNELSKRGYAYEYWQSNFRKKKSARVYLTDVSGKTKYFILGNFKMRGRNICPDIELLPQPAAVLNISIDSLLGYPSQSVTDYDNHYNTEWYYWGLVPNSFCYEMVRI